MVEHNEHSTFSQHLNIHDVWTMYRHRVLTGSNPNLVKKQKNSKERKYLGNVTRFLLFPDSFISPNHIYMNRGTTKQTKSQASPAKTQILGLLPVLSASRCMLNPLYIDGLLHCYILDESICSFSGVWSILSLLFYF